MIFTSIITLNRLTPRSHTAGRARGQERELGRGGTVAMLHDHEMQDCAGARGSDHEWVDVVAQPSIASEDAEDDLSDALLHLSDVLIREMFTVSLRLNEDFARVAGDPAAGSAHALITRLDQRIKELRGASFE
jgi:hypothetical protein